MTDQVDRNQPSQVLNDIYAELEHAKWYLDRARFKSNHICIALKINESIKKEKKGRPASVNKSVQSPVKEILVDLTD